jgi:hypothetical protein
MLLLSFVFKLPTIWGFLNSHQWVATVVASDVTIVIVVPTWYYERGKKKGGRERGNIRK